MIAFAQEHYGAAIHPNLHFEVGDARNLCYHHEFNQIVSFNALHWIPEQDAVLRSIRTALKPDGQPLLQFVPEGARKCEDAIEEVYQLPRWVHYFQKHHKSYFHPTPEAYRALVEQNGLQVLRIEVEDKSWDFQSR